MTASALLSQHRFRLLRVQETARASNYHEWRMSTRTLLHATRQWVVITGTATAPIPIDPVAPTPDESAALDAWHVRSWALYIELTY